MSDSTLLNSLPKIYFDRKKNRGISYVKAYDGNAWNADKGYAVKINTRTIGVIDSPDALGLIRFNKDFLELRPDFKDVAVVSYFDTDEGKHKLRIEHNLNANVVTKHFDSCSHDVTHVYSIGTYDVFMKLLEGDPLLKTLKESFADNWSELLSLAFYCLKDGDFTSNRYAMYAQSHKLPCQDPLTLTSITRLFQSISKEDELNFFTKYIEELYCAHELPTRRFWALDSTSISTYAKLADAKFGHNKQNEDIPQINVLMITDQKTGRPIFYNRFNGAIPDVSTVTSTFETLLHLGTRSFVAVMDRGYYSKENMNMIISSGYHFLLCIPLDKVSVFSDAIDEAAVAFLNGDKYISAIDENVFTKQGSYTFKINGKEIHKKLFVHVFYDQEKAGAFTKKIQKRRNEIMRMIKEGLTLDANNKSFADVTLCQNEDGSIGLNNQAFQEANKHAGVFVLVSDCVADGKQAYYGYRDRRTVEECFSDLKVKMCCDRFRVSSEDSLVGKCFVEFIALSLYMRMEMIIRKAMDKNKEVPHHSVKTIIEDLEGITEIAFADSFVTIKPISKTQKKCLKLFNTSEPVSRYVQNIAVPNMIKYARKPHGDKVAK